jgi:DNA-binding NarL/FixJ family response regulator
MVTRKPAMQSVRGDAQRLRQLRILLLEDRAADAEMVVAAIEQAGLAAAYERARSEREFTAALRTFAPDIILSDHSLARFNAPAALDVMRAERSSAPLIVVADALDEGMTVKCLRAGAEDIVLKTNLSRLAPSIMAALQARATLRDLSPRQLEVLRLVAQGFTTREIARRLKLSAKTVDTHRGELMKRLGIHDAIGLVRFALRRGLVAPET